MTATCRGLAVLAFVLSAAAADAGPLLFKKSEPAPAPRPVPLEEMEGPHQALARPLVEKPTLAARGPVETFACRPEHYHWFLENPDRAVVAWRRLGAKCVSITPRGEGFFGWCDDQGSDVVWRTLHRAPGLRVWYAEGKVKPAPVLPLVPVKALVVLRHSEGKTVEGKSFVRHSSDLFVQTDSRAASAVTKLMGQSAPKLAEQGLGQLQLFFSGLSWYLQRHPDQAEALLRTGDDAQGKK